MKQSRFPSRSQTQRSSNFGLIFRQGDPQEYGYICPNCLTRYGTLTNARKEIEITRCLKCPPFSVQVIEKRVADERQRRRVKRKSIKN